MSYGSSGPSVPEFTFTPQGVGGGGGDGFPNPIKFSTELLGNLASDVSHAATGFFPGLYKFATDPVDAIGAVIDQYKYTYGPAFSGDLGETAHRIYEHPLGPILDVAALFTGGAAAAGKASQLAKTGGLAAPGGKIERFADFSSTPNLRVLTDNPASPSRRDAFKQGATPDIPRVPILRYGHQSTAAKIRTKYMDQFKNHLSSKGGVFNIDPKQMGYERAYLSDISGAAGSVEYFWGSLDKALTATKGMAPFQRANSIRTTFLTNHANAKAAAIAENRVALLSDYAMGNYNKQAYGGLAKPGVVLKMRGPDGKKWWTHEDNDVISETFRGLGNKMTAPNAKKVETFKGDDGQTYVPLVNRQTMENLGLDAAQNSNAVVNAYYKGTAVWKAAVLGLVPRFFVNNAIGNSFMYLMDNAGDGAIFGMYKSRQYMHGMEKADLELARMVGDAGVLKGRGWLENNFADQIAQTFHSSALSTSKQAARYNKRKEGEHVDDPRTPTEQIRGEHVVQENKITRAAQPLLRFASKHAERNLRIAVIMLRTRKLPEHKAEVKRLKGLYGASKKTEEQIFNEAATNVFKKNPALARRISQQVERSMGNYNALNRAERSLRAVDPFYTWQRHIFKHTFHMAANRPARTAAMAEVGRQGYDEAQEMLGGLAPDFMGGMIGVDIPGVGADNRDLMFNTTGMNPYAAFGEEAKMLQSLIPGGDGPQIGETLGTQMNPFLQAGIEGMGGTSLLTGQPKSTQTYGPVDAFLRGIAPFDIPVQPFANLPHVRLAEHTLFPADYKEPTLYAKNPLEDLSSFLGFPLRDVYMSKVDDLAKSQATRRGEG